VTRADIAQHLDRINRDIGAPTASRARAHISALFTWCLRRGLCRENPVIATEAPKVDSERTRALSADELRQVWNTCDDDSDYSKIVRLLVLTGARREEIGGLRWSEIDMAASTIKLPGARTKNGREHVLTLPEMAMEIIRAVKPREGRDHLFGERADGFRIWAHAKAKLDGKLGEMKSWRLHDVRHTVSTGMHELGVEPHHVEAVLNHVSGHKGGVAGKYNHATYPAQMAQALARWADHVAAIVTGKPAKVVPMRGRAA
jgi:integrase